MLAFASSLAAALEHLRQLRKRPLSLSHELVARAGGTLTQETRAQRIMAAVPRIYAGTDVHSQALVVSYLLIAVAAAAAAAASATVSWFW